MRYNDECYNNSHIPYKMFPIISLYNSLDHTGDYNCDDHLEKKTEKKNATYRANTTP